MGKIADLLAAKSYLKPISWDRPTSKEDPEDLRIRNLLSESHNSDIRTAILGFCSDEGVRRNGGRTGAARAPDSIRKHWLKMVSKNSAYMKTVWDAGNIICTGDVENDQKNLGEVVQILLENNIKPVILGGGHETAFGHALGYKKYDDPISVINIDAHLDVRPLKNGNAHSGSPFRQMIEHPEIDIEHYGVIGAQKSAVAIHHKRWVEENASGKVLFRDDEDENLDYWESLIGKPIYLSIDMDVIDQSQAPGVSAPCADGLTTREVLEIIGWLKENCDIRSADIVECNPEFDRDEQTQKLAARLLWELIQ